MNQPFKDTPVLHDVLIVGAGPCGLAVAARLREAHPSALFTDEEQARYKWIAQHAAKATIKDKRTGKVRPRTGDGPNNLSDEPLSMLVLDGSGSRWMSKWKRLFETFGISHLRSPMFFHPDPQDRDALLAYAYSTERAGELEEITGCVGKEISKHRRKKERKTNVKAKPIVTIDERDRKDYYTPSSAMFNDFCESCIRRYNLGEEHYIKQELVTDICFGDCPDYLPVANKGCEIFTVRTENGIHHARVVVLAVGAGKPAIPAPFSDTPHEAASHAMMIRRHKGILLEPSVKAKMAKGMPTSVLVIGGGLTSAQVADAAVKSGVSKVYLLMRSAWKIKPFDVDLSWIAKFKNHQQASFWSADTDAERVEYIKEARNGGSITPRFSKKLRQHMETGKLSVHCHTVVKSQTYDAGTQTWALSTEPPIVDLPAFDFIYFATGAATDMQSLSFLDRMREDHPIDMCGGLPVLTDDLMWSPDVPLFLTGRLASLRLGPGAGNLEGARVGAERVAWKIEDLLSDGARRSSIERPKDGRRDSAHERYVAGVGSRFESLVSDDATSSD